SGNVATHDPSCTGPRPTSRHPCPTADPATSGLTRSQGGGDRIASASAGGGSAGGGTAFRPSWSSAGPPVGSSVTAGRARADAIPLPATLTANAAAAPTAV